MSVINDTETTPYTVDPDPRSSFLLRDLLHLNDKTKSYNSKLAIIGHVDLNAFFAQVEQVRLNLSIDDPVVCVQWQAVIAVNYAARKYGIKRMDTIEICKKKCPNLILAHAAVYEKGSYSWRYLDKLPFQGLCKVSLDPYRRESRKIFRILTANCDLIEKASVDEGYMDLGRIIYEKLKTMYPEVLKGEPDDSLPPIPTSFDVPFKGHVYRREDEQGQKDDVFLRDWDDLITVLASNVMYDVRKQIFDKLEYTTSAGISRNKNMAKLAGGFLKPDNQTVLLNSQVSKFLLNFELTEINGMGGKYGDSILSHYMIPGDENSIGYLNKLSVEELTTEKFPNLPKVIKGDLPQQLRDRVDIKSMMSRKQMMNKFPVNTLFDALQWIQTFSGDLCNRLEDLDEESGVLTRPKTVSVNLLVNWQSTSRQCPIPISTDLDKLKKQLIKLSLNLIIEVLQGSHDLSKMNTNLDLKNIDEKNKVTIPPIMNMAVIISSLTRLESSIDLFAKKANKSENQFEKYQATVAKDAREAEAKEASKSPPRPVKKMDKEFINKMFQEYEKGKPTVSPPIESNESKKLDKQYISKLFEDFNKTAPSNSPTITKSTKPVNPMKSSSSSPKSTKRKAAKSVAKTAAKSASKTPQIKKPRYNILDNLKAKPSSSNPPSNSSSPPASTPPTKAQNSSLKSPICPKCNQIIENSQEHDDYHFALELSKSHQ